MALYAGRYRCCHLFSLQEASPAPIVACFCERHKSKKAHIYLRNYGKKSKASLPLCLALTHLGRVLIMFAQGVFVGVLQLGPHSKSHPHLAKQQLLPGRVFKTPSSVAALWFPLVVSSLLLGPPGDVLLRLNLDLFNLA